MKKLDPKTAKEISLVDLAKLILETFASASRSQQAQITIVLKQNFRGPIRATGTGCLIDCGGSDTYIVLEGEQPYGLGRYGAPHAGGFYSISDVFQSLSTHLTELKEAWIRKQIPFQETNDDE